MAAGVRQYDPKQVSVIFGGTALSGFTDGTFVNLERNEQSFTLKVGVDGIGTRARSNNNSGKCTVTFHQSSSSNDYLSGVSVSDENTGSGALPLLVKDNSGRTIATALTAWVQKPANGEFGKEVSNRVWVLETDNLVLFDGGN